MRDMPLTPWISPADNVADGRRVPEQSIAYSRYVHHPDGRLEEMGACVLTISRAVRQGQALLRRERIYTHRTGETEVRFDEAQLCNLQPVSTAVDHDNNPVIRTEYDGRVIHSAHPVWPAGPEGTETRLTLESTLSAPRPVFEGSSLGMIIAALPLAVGYSARLLTFMADLKPGAQFLFADVTVIGEDTCATRENEPLPCWLVRVDADRRWTFWINQSDAAISLVRVCEDLPDGSQDIYQA